MLVSGFCPVQQEKYAINVNYVNASSLEKRRLEKGTFRCDYILSGNKCNGNNCPIYKDAPQYK